MVKGSALCMKMVGTILTIYLQLYTPSEALETIKVSSVRPVTSALPGILGGGRYMYLIILFSLIPLAHICIFSLFRCCDCGVS